jgi:hypothetical protein
MLKRDTRRMSLIAGALPILGAFAWLLVAGAASGEVYAWRTEDGGYAYTDDPDQIPQRYADEAKPVGGAGLDGYERFTRTDPAATDRYAERLAKRLRYLREVNAASAPTRVAPRSRGVTSVSVATGNPQAPFVDIDAETSGAPVVVEPVRTLDPGSAVTRQTTVVKQGGKTIAVLKGQTNEIRLDEDIIDARQLEPED